MHIDGIDALHDPIGTDGAASARIWTTRDAIHIEDPASKAHAVALVSPTLGCRTCVMQGTCQRSMSFRQVSLATLLALDLQPLA